VKTKKTIVRRALSLLLTLLMVLSLVPMTAFSAFAQELSEATEGLPEISVNIGSDYKVTLKDADSDGYYDIGNADELNAFTTLVNDGNTSLNAELTADIFMNKGVIDEENSSIESSSTPIGSEMNPYTGIFDGNNHVVSGFNSRSSLECDGLFCCVGEGGVVKNTGVINSYLGAGYQKVGAVVGINKGTVTNCYNDNSTLRSNSGVMGGVVGLNEGTVANCYSIGDVRGREYIGGVVGYNAGVITNCYNTGTVDGGRYVGGMVGLNEGTITNCYYLDTCGASDINAVSKTSEEFKSGEVAYLLQEGQTEEIWGQKLGTDNYPVLGGDKVYFAKDCIGDSCYSNTNEDGQHCFRNGFCACGELIEAAKLNEDGVYEIGNAGQLYWFAKYVNAGNTSANAILTDNIVVNEGVMTSESTDARDWTPIGNDRNNYAGAFDGNGKTISGLYFDFAIEIWGNNIGLIGYMSGGSVSNVGVINSYFKGYGAVGSIVGYCDSGTVTNCYNTGAIGGRSEAGGIVGWNEAGTVTNCYNTGAVSGEGGVGGIIGFSSSSGNVINCYNTGKIVSSAWNAGGVIGQSASTVTNCYNIGEVSCDSYGGGVIGHNAGTVTNCYSIGEVSCNSSYGGGVMGYSSVEITNCYYLNTTYNGGVGGYDVAGSAEAKTAEQFKSGEVAYFLQTGVQGEEIWGQKLGTDNYPVLGGDKVYGGYTACTDTDKTYTNDADVSEERIPHNYVNGFCTGCGGIESATDENEDGVFEIGNAGQLYWFAEYVNAGNTYADAILTDNIVVNEGEMASNSTDARVWTPIGNESKPYKGTFDGNNKTVSGLYFNNSEAEYVGLFGYMGEMGAVNGTVKNIGVINSYFKGLMFVGGVVGYAQGVTITNCYNTSTVVGQNYAGGMAGYAEESTVANCYSTGVIDGNDGIGMIGWIMNVTVDNCYYLDTSCYIGIGNGSDTEGSIEAKTSEEFASGEVAYLLQGEQTDDIWGQKIGTDELPVLGGDKVYYGYTSCEDDATAVYTNDSNVASGNIHNFVNGFCTICEAYEPATDENEDGVYEIGNAGQLYWFADKVNNDNANYGSANAILTEDIVVNEGVMTAETEGARVWTPIGKRTQETIGYSGSFDGQNFTVSGLYFNDSKASEVGMFGVLYGGSVKNIGVINSYFNGDGYVGGVVGWNNISEVTNCYNTGVVNGSWSAGGVVGYNYYSTLSNCYNTGAVSSAKFIGGVAGASYMATLANCYYLDSTCSGGVDGADVAGSAEAKTAEQFKSGEVAYLLQGEQAEEIWGQNIGTDNYPVLGGDKVYAVTKCNGEAISYNNTKSETLDHPTFKNGFCTVCDAFEPATDENEDGVYEIGNAGQLYWFADKVTNDNANYGYANAILTADIVVNEGEMTSTSTDARAWTPIGNITYKYSGTFDGNNKTISGLYFNDSNVDCIGLFGYVGKEGVVKNTGVINSCFIGNNSVGSVAGGSFGTITNCYNTGVVSGSGYVGGIVGFNTTSGGAINCYNSGNVSGSFYIGGIVGNNTAAPITNCYNTGIVDGDDSVGGVAGYGYSGKITNCYNTGRVEGSKYVAGVVGYDNYSKIDNCYNTGYVSGDVCVGGVVAYIDNSTITNCYYLDTACNGGIGIKDSADAEDVEGSAEAKTAEAFASGEVAYLLQGEQEELVWGQKIGTDELPVLGGDKVYYGYTSCADNATAVYTNDSSVTAEKPAHKEFRAEFTWDKPYDGECYVYVELYCTDCGGYVDSGSSYATLKETVEAEDCMHPGSELYEVTFEYEGVTYTDTKEFCVKSDNHTGEFVNGFCTDCGGFEPAKYNEETGVYEIENAGQLYWYAQKLNEENAEIYAKLMNDIIIPDDAPNWTPINCSNAYFDGNFKTISGLMCVDTDADYVGLFGCEGWWYEISNLHITDSYFEGKAYVGAVVACMTNGGSVTNCYVTNTTVKGDSDNVGTLVGYMVLGNIINCYVDTDNLVGYYNDSYATVENSYYLADTDDGNGGKTLEQFASGEVAYLLQGEQEEEIWGQNIGTDDYPTLCGDKVYMKTDAEDNTVYYNEAVEEKNDKLAGYTISLGDKIAVNYYMSLTEKTINDANAKMVFTVPDTGATYTLEIPVSSVTPNKDGYYVFTCEVAAKEMTSAISAKLVTSEGELQLDDYTVQEYAEVILSDTVKYAKEQELVKKMLNYGAQAQIYFNYNTDNLANDTEYMTEEEKVTELYGFAGAPFTLEGEESGVTYYGTALSLETELAFKHYFIIDESVDAQSLEITCDYPATLKKNGSFYELIISDIPAHKMGENSLKVAFGGITLDYTIYSYGALAQNAGKEVLWTVVSALAHFAGEATMYAYK